MLADGRAAAVAAGDASTVLQSWLRLPDPVIIARLNKEVAAVLADPGVLKQLADRGMKPMMLAPADVAACLARERKALAAHQIGAD